MARPESSGIPYFPIVTDWDQKLKLVRAKYKLVGVGCIVELWKTIYAEGYAIAWDEDAELLFCDVNSIDLATLREIVSFAASKGVFDKRLLEERRVLTSHGIQKQWLAVVRKAHRTSTEIDPELCLLTDSELEGVKVERKPRERSEKYRGNPANAAESSEETTQRKEKKSKEKNQEEMAPVPLRGPTAISDADLTASFPDEPFSDPPEPKAPPADPLYKPIMDSCLAVAERFANYAKEGAAAKRLCKMIRDRKPENPEEFTREILELFLTLRKTGTPFWRGQPFTPSAISAAGIFDRLMVEYEKRRERADTSWIPEELGAPV